MAEWLRPLTFSDLNRSSHNKGSTDPTDTSRAKTLSIIVEFLSKLAKEEDGGKATLKELIELLKLKVNVEEPEAVKAETKKVEVEAEPESKSDNGTISKETASKVVGTYSFRKDFKILGQLGVLKFV